MKKKKGVRSKSASPKLKGFLGVQRGKKSEPDNAIVQPQSMPIGMGVKSSKPNPGSKAASRGARMKRLEGKRI